MKLIDYPKFSSHIKEYSHENGILTVRFKNGDKRYKYVAPESAFHEMKAAPSKGQYFHAAKKGWKPL